MGAQLRSSMTSSSLLSLLYIQTLLPILIFSSLLTSPSIYCLAQEVSTPSTSAPVGDKQSLLTPSPSSHVNQIQSASSPFDTNSSDSNQLMMHPNNNNNRANTGGLPNDNGNRDSNRDQDEEDEDEEDALKNLSSASPNVVNTNNNQSAGDSNQEYHSDYVGSVPSSPDAAFNGNLNTTSSSPSYSDLSNNNDDYEDDKSAKGSSSSIVNGSSSLNSPSSNQMMINMTRGKVESDVTIIHDDSVDKGRKAIESTAGNEVGEDVEDDDEESEGSSFHDLTTHPQVVLQTDSTSSSSSNVSDSALSPPASPSIPSMIQIPSVLTSSSSETSPSFGGNHNMNSNHDPENNQQPHHIISSSNNIISSNSNKHDPPHVEEDEEDVKSHKKSSPEKSIIDYGLNDSSIHNHNSNLHHLAHDTMLFRFTKDHYNVSIAEDAPGKSYASVIIDNRVQITSASSSEIIPAEHHASVSSLPVLHVPLMHHLRHNDPASRTPESLTSRDNFYSNIYLKDQQQHNNIRHEDPYLMMGVFVGSDPNMIVKYRIASGDDRKMFKAESRKVGDFYFLLIRTRSSDVVLNREYQELFHLKVRASIYSKRDKSMKFKSRCDVTVRVEDANDLSPLFYPTVYNLDVPEDTPLDKSILRVTAFDPDIGLNGEIYYSLDPNDNNQDFAVHPTLGIISVTRPLTARYRDSRRAHHKRQLMIYARDRATRGSSSRSVGPTSAGPSLASSSRAIVNINIIPVNNDNDLDLINEGHNRPSSKSNYDPSAYHFSVGENSKFATIVGVINETSSPDSYDSYSSNNSNGTLFSSLMKYKLINYKNKFSLDHKSGLLSVKGFLDREEQDSYKLYASVSDGHLSSASSSTVTIFVSVTDVNDNPPIFREKTYYATVREDLPIGSVIMRMKAFDSDLGAGGQIRYSIRKSPADSSSIIQDQHENDVDTFTMDEFMGTVRVSKELDFERKQFYNLTIMARDDGIPSFSSFATLLIEIEDVDENQFAPKFEDFVLIGSVKEKSPVGSFVMSVTAVDEDDVSQAPSYHMVAGSGLGKFAVDHEGRITTSVVFDSKKQENRFWITVMARDKSAIPKSSHVQIFIQILDNDENENDPSSPSPPPSMIASKEPEVNDHPVSTFIHDDGDVCR